MNCNDIKPGMKVKVTRDDGTEGMFVLPDNIRTRGVGKIGTVINYVPGHGGDVWFVRHGDGVAAYCFTELEVSLSEAYQS